jgi:hypothetical protein
LPLCSAPRGADEGSERGCQRLGREWGPRPCTGAPAGSEVEALEARRGQHRVETLLPEEENRMDSGEP